MSIPDLFIIPIDKNNKTTKLSNVLYYISIKLCQRHIFNKWEIQQRSVEQFTQVNSRTYEHKKFPPIKSIRFVNCSVSFKMLCWYVSLHVSSIDSKLVHHVFGQSPVLVSHSLFLTFTQQWKIMLSLYRITFARVVRISYCRSEEVNQYLRREAELLRSLKDTLTTQTSSFTSVCQKYSHPSQTIL